MSSDRYIIDTQTEQEIAKESKREQVEEEIQRERERAQVY